MGGQDRVSGPDVWLGCCWGRWCLWEGTPWSHSQKHWAETSAGVSQAHEETGEVGPGGRRSSVVLTCWGEQSTGESHLTPEGGECVYVCVICMYVWFVHTCAYTTLKNGNNSVTLNGYTERECTYIHNNYLKTLYIYIYAKDEYIHVCIYVYTHKNTQRGG